MADHGFDLEAVQKKLGGHSVFAPSASAMWLNCSGSLIPNLLAEDTAGVEAAEGTVAHACAEMWLTTHTKPRHLLGTVERVQERKEAFDIRIDEVMLDFVGEYVDWCVYLPGDHYIEQRVDFSDLTPLPNQGGTADFIACLPGKLIIRDLKYGKGVQVFAEKNTQLRLYAYGAFRKYDHLYHFETIEMGIGQPRLGHFETWTITREELLEFAAWVKDRAALAWRPDAPRTPGEKQCLWCKVKGSCIDLAAHMHSLVEGVFDDLTDSNSSVDVVRFVERLDDAFDEFEIHPAPIHTLTMSQKVRIIKFRKTVENWFKRIEDEIEETLQKGSRVPGFKLVEGRSNRLFAKGNSAAESLELLSGIPTSEFIDVSIKSPAQVEEVLKNHGVPRKELGFYLDGLVVKPPGKPVMAPAHDNRAELIVGDEDAFEDLTDGEL